MTSHDCLAPEDVLVFVQDCLDGACATFKALSAYDARALENCRSAVLADPDAVRIAASLSAAEPHAVASWLNIGDPTCWPVEEAARYGIDMLGLVRDELALVSRGADVPDDGDDAAPCDGCEAEGLVAMLAESAIALGFASERVCLLALDSAVKARLGEVAA